MTGLGLKSITFRPTVSSSCLLLSWHVQLVSFGYCLWQQTWLCTSQQTASGWRPNREVQSRSQWYQWPGQPRNNEINMIKCSNLTGFLGDGILKLKFAFQWSCKCLSHNTTPMNCKKDIESAIQSIEKVSRLKSNFFPTQVCAQRAKKCCGHSPECYPWGLPPLRK